MEAAKATLESAGLNKQNIFMIVLAVIEVTVICIIAWKLTELTGSPDNNNELVKTIIPISCLLGLLIMIHTVLWYIYFQNDSSGMSVYFFISGAVSMIFSLIALSVSLCQRS